MLWPRRARALRKACSKQCEPSESCRRIRCRRHVSWHLTGTANALGGITRTIGGPYAVLVAAQLAFSGARVILGLTSAGQALPGLRMPPRTHRIGRPPSSWNGTRQTASSRWRRRQRRSSPLALRAEFDVAWSPTLPTVAAICRRLSSTKARTSLDSRFSRQCPVPAGVICRVSDRSRAGSASADTASRDSCG